MEFFEFTQMSQAILALIVAFAMFAMFIREYFPAEVVAIGGVAVMLFLGLLPYDEGLKVLANPAPWTIAAMFLVMGALVRTGALDAFTVLADRMARTNPRAAIGMLMAFVILASAIMNNTPVVVVMLAVFVQFARTMGL